MTSGYKVGDKWVTNKVNMNDKWVANKLTMNVKWVTSGQQVLQIKYA